MDIGMSDFKFMDGKRVGVLMDTEGSGRPYGGERTGQCCEGKGL